MMAERLGVAKSTYLKIEKGEPTVAMGAYAMTFFVLGFDGALGEIVDPRRDDQGLLLDAERLPKRLRTRKALSRYETGHRRLSGRGAAAARPDALRPAGRAGKRRVRV